MSKGLGQRVCQMLSALIFSAPLLQLSFEDYYFEFKQAEFLPSSMCVCFFVFLSNCFNPEFFSLFDTVRTSIGAWLRVFAFIK